MLILPLQTQHNQNSMGLLRACISLFLLAAYLPLIIWAGISVDDWGDIAHNLECTSFWNCYGAWFPLFSNRPLAPLPITALTFALGTWYSGYLVVNSLLYLVALAICAKVIETIRGIHSSVVFLLLAAIPIIAMPVITSPINQSTATVSFLLWASSLWCLLRFTQTQAKHYWILAYGLLLAAFLTYEVILPLLVFTVLLPWILDSKVNVPWSPRYIKRFLLPIIGILAIVTLWQKGIAPQYMEVDSRLKFIPSQAIAKLHTFFDVFYRQLPALFLKMPAYLSLGGFSVALLGVSAFYLSSKPTSSSEDAGKRSNRLLLASILCFLASSSIFILSNESAIIGGYQARGLSSTWIGFAILMASISPKIHTIRRIWQILLAVLISLCALCFSIERNQTIAAWQMQMAIVQNAQILINKESLVPGATLMADVPHYLINNFNDEIVFSQPWDFGAAIALATNNQIKAGPVIDSTRGEMRQLRLENAIVMAQNFSGSSLEQFWIYRFNVDSATGSLMKISSPSQFEKLIEDLQNSQKQIK